MLDTQKTLKLSLILTDIFLCVLIIVTALLPFGVSWYVEIKHRSQSLASTIMVTCYPCAPFLGFALLKLRKILKAVLSGSFPSERVSHDFRVICCCCLIIALITLIAGRYYLPFYIVCGTFLFLSLLIYIFNAITKELSSR